MRETKQGILLKEKPSRVSAVIKMIFGLTLIAAALIYFGIVSGRGKNKAENEAAFKLGSDFSPEIVKISAGEAVEKKAAAPKETVQAIDVRQVGNRIIVTYPSDKP